MIRHETEPIGLLF